MSAESTASEFQRRYHVVLKADQADSFDVYLTGYSMPHEEAATFMSKVTTPRSKGQRLMLEEVPEGPRWTAEQAVALVKEAALGNPCVPLEDRLPSRAQVIAYLQAAGYTAEGREYKSAEGLIVEVGPEYCEVPTWPERHRNLYAWSSIVTPEVRATIQDIAVAAAEDGTAIWNWMRVSGVLCQLAAKKVEP